STATGRIRSVSSEAGELLETHEAGDAQDEYQRHSNREGGHRGRGGIERILEVGEELDGKRGQLRAGQEERQGEIVEGDGKGEDRPRHHAGLDYPQRDLEERPHRVGAQALRGLLQRDVEVGQRGGDRADHVGCRDHDVADQERRVRGLHLEQRVELQKGDAGEDLGQEQGRGDERVEQISPAEASAYERDGGGRADDGGGNRGPEGQLG